MYCHILQCMICVYAYCVLVFTEIKMYLCNCAANWLEGDSDDDDDYCGYDSWKKVCVRAMQLTRLCN